MALQKRPSDDMISFWEWCFERDSYKFRKLNRHVGDEDPAFQAQLENQALAPAPDPQAAQQQAPLEQAPIAPEQDVEMDVEMN